MSYCSEPLGLPSLNSASYYPHITSVKFMKKANTFALCQATLKTACSFEGVGVHSGLPVLMRICPAGTQRGFKFVRTDIEGELITRSIEASYDAVVDTRMSTTLMNQFGIKISTTEHVMAALIGAGITNALIEVSGPEIPIMDGSSIVFATAFEQAGIKMQGKPQKIHKISKTVRVETATGFAEFSPHNERTFDVTYDFAGRFTDTDHKGSFFFNLDTDSFAHLVSNARTFGLYEDGVRLQELGLAKGASLENTVILKNDLTIMNEEGLRSADEFIRHKVLDALGDVALANCAIIGAYKAYNPSHELNNKLLRALFLESFS